MLSYQVESGAGEARRAHWNQAIREVYGPRSSLNPARPGDFRMSMQAVQIGSVTLSRASLSQAEITTQPHPYRAVPARSYNIYIVDRTQHLVLGGRSLILEPGDFTLADSALASTITTDQAYTTIGLTVPAGFLRAYVPHPERAVGVRFSGSEGLSRVVSLMLRDMWRIAETGALADVGSRLLVSLLEAFSACCDLALSRSTVATSNAAARRAQIRDGIRNHLRDPEFTVKMLGRKLGLSTRYMQMIFNDGEESISQYIRRQRLEGCRRELADPAWREHSVTAIAFRWGFNSAAHFCRAFRAQYATSPSRYREDSLKVSKQA
jgi:AraC-like DNA-binding protein